MVSRGQGPCARAHGPALHCTCLPLRVHGPDSHLCVFPTTGNRGLHAAALHCSYRSSPVCMHVCASPPSSPGFNTSGPYPEWAPIQVIVWNYSCRLHAFVAHVFYVRQPSHYTRLTGSQIKINIMLIVYDLDKLHGKLLS